MDGNISIHWQRPSHHQRLSARCDQPLTASQATSLVHGSRRNEVRETRHARPDAAHEGWDSPGIHLRLTSFGSLVKDVLCLGLQVQDAEVGVLELFPFCAFATTQAPRFFLPQEGGETALLLPWGIKSGQIPFLVPL